MSLFKLDKFVSQEAFDAVVRENAKLIDTLNSSFTLLVKQQMKIEEQVEKISNFVSKPMIVMCDHCANDPDKIN